MRKLLGLALPVPVIAVLSLVVACGSNPSVGGRSGGGASSLSTVALTSDFQYGGRLETNENAVDAVLALLKSEAKTDPTKLYLAEYLMVAQNRDVTVTPDKQTWYVSFTMDRKPDQSEGEKPYWSGAAWMVFKDGKVLPSSRHSGNASRIIMDLRGATR